MTIKERLAALMTAHPKAKTKIKELFNDILKDEIYVTIPENVLDGYTTNKFVYIGKSRAPEESLRDRCLILNNVYDWEIKTFNNRIVLIPRKKIV